MKLTVFQVLLFQIITLCNLSIIETTYSDNQNTNTAKSNIRFLNSVNDESPKRVLTNFICNNPEKDCSGNGFCNTQGNDCFCNSGYTTLIIPEKTISAKCDYEMKQQLKAFLLELFVGFGAGHFYSLRYLHASLKLVAFLFGIYLICLFPLTAKCINDKFDSDFFVFFVSCYYYLCAIGLAFWFIWDLVYFGLNKYNDGNNVPLLKWGNPTN